MTHIDCSPRLPPNPAFVFGSSIGALIGLDLFTHYSGQVRVLVAHEPPAFELLPDLERDRATQLQLDAEVAFQREGVEAAFKRFVTLAAVDYSDREPDVALPPPTSQRSANLSFFLTNDAPAVRRYHLDIAALRTSATQIVAAVGRSAPERAPYKATEALAARIAREVVAFPGGHTAWLLRPKEFAAKLREVLR
jgi:pimeloyl-ACP methyl ester carboxylesterase